LPTVQTIREGVFGGALGGGVNHGTLAPRRAEVEEKKGIPRSGREWFIPGLGKHNVVNGKCILAAHPPQESREIRNKRGA